MRAVIEVHGIVNRFGAQVVHNGLDMEVYEGEIFGIVGGTGSGKSVLLRTILGLRQPNGGSVSFLGRDPHSLNAQQLSSLKASYGVTFQEGALFTALTLKQNVQMPMLEHLEELSSRPHSMSWPTSR